MKKNLLLYSFAIFILQLTNAQTNLLTESFETDGEGTRYVSNPFQVSCDFFLRDDNTFSCLTNNPTGLDGSYYWTGEDTDTGVDPTGILTLNPLVVTGFTLDIDVLLGLGRPNDFRFEPDDELLFQYNMDGGGWVTFAAFYGSNDGLPASTGNLVQDTDLNGAYNAGAPEINSSAMQNFNFTIPATGNSVQVRFIMGQDGGTEETIIDNIRINGTPALPIELTEFSVKKMEEDKVKINWQTASEENNEYFSVQRSSDGFSWEDISRINGAGNSTFTIDYSIVDEKPFSGVSYYRLKQVDFNGDFEFSNIKSVRLELPNSRYSIYPNPTFSNQINIKIPNDNTEIQILDASGKVILQKIIDKGISKISLHEFHSGIYFVKFIHVEKMETQKLIVEVK